MTSANIAVAGRVGTVRDIVGFATATDPDGQVRQLSSGDTIRLGDLIEAAQGSTLLVAFENGGYASIGAGDAVRVDAALVERIARVVAAEQAAELPTVEEDLLTESLQRQSPEYQLREESVLSSEMDEGQVFEEENQPQEEGSSFVIVHQNAARGWLTPGFETGTFGYISEPKVEYTGVVFELPEVLLDGGTLDVIVDEAGLPDGTRAFNRDAHPIEQSSHFEVNTHLNLGLGDLTINGTSVMSLLQGGGPVSITVPGYPGTFLVTGVTGLGKGLYYVFYDVQLTGNYQHNQEREHTFYFDVVVTNVEGISIGKTGSITVINDVPSARNDSRSLEETGEPDTGIDGNVVTGAGDPEGADTAGADGFSHVEWHTAETGPYQLTESSPGSGLFTVTDALSNSVGTINLQADGTYRFSLSPDYNIARGGSISIHLPYTIFDGDGDTARATLTLNVDGNDESPLISGIIDEILVHEDGLETGAVTGSRAGEAGHPTAENGSIGFLTTELLKHITIAGFEMTAGTDANGVSNGVFSYDGTRIYVDANGNQVAQAASVGYVTVVSISKTGAGYQVNYSFTLTQNLLGTDPATETHDQPGDLSGAEQIRIAVSATDQTNDSVSSQITVTVLDDTPFAPDFAVSLTETGNEISVEGSVLNDTNALQEQVLYGADGSAAQDRFTWGEVPSTVGQNGEFTLRTAGVSGDWMLYELVSGSTVIGTLRLSTLEDGNYDFTLNAGYTLDRGIQVPIAVPYTVKDGDHDTASGTLTITLTGENTVPSLQAGNVTVYEKGLAGSEDPTDRRYDKSPGSDAGRAAISASGVTAINSNEIIDEITIASKAANSFSLTLQSNADGQFTVGSDARWYINQAGEVVQDENSSIGLFEILSVVKRVDGSGYDVSYRFTLYDNAGNGPRGSSTDGSFNIEFTVGATDHTGDRGTVDASIVIVDDIPLARNDRIDFDEAFDTQVTGNVLVNDHAGADGWEGGGWNAGSGSSSAPHNGVTVYQLVTGGYTAELNGVTVTQLQVGEVYQIMHEGQLVGNFVLNQNGDYVFTRPAGSTGMDEDVILQLRYTVRDGDGDESSANLAIHISNSEIAFYLTGDTVVYEEARYGAENPVQGWNHSGDNSYTRAGYFINWTSYANGSIRPTPAGSSLKAGMDFTFELAFRSTGGATYDADVKFMVNGASGIVYLTQDTVAEYMSAINSQLAIQYGQVGSENNVSVTEVRWLDGHPVLIFQVKDGTILDSPLSLTMEAVDDNINDSGEKYSLALRNPIVTEGGEAGDVHIIQDPATPQGAAGVVETTIYDGGNTGYGSGQWLKVMDATVFESTVVDGVERGSDLVVGIQLYDPSIGGGPYTGRIPPEQDMTVTFSYSQDTAEAQKDYLPDANTATISQTAWVAYDTLGTPVVYYDTATQQWVDTGGLIDHWAANVTIAGLIVDDSLSEQDETFGIIVDRVEGNESAPVYTDQIGGTNGSGATVTIRDDNVNHPDGTPAEGGHYKDGPHLVSFALVNGRTNPDGAGNALVEPIAPGVIGDGTADQPTTTGSYLLTLDSAAAEDIIVTLALGGNSTPGMDYTLSPAARDGNNELTGDGLLSWSEVQEYYATRGGLPAYLVQQASPADFYYLIVKQGAASAGFDILIRHDHDSSAKTGGLDSGTETIDWTIVGMDGSEVQWSESDPKNSLSTEILDDMMGPVVELGQFTLNQDNTINGTIQLADQVAMGEDVIVTLRMIGSDGNFYYYELTLFADGQPVPISNLDLGLFETESGQPLNVDSLVYFYLQISDTFGGETRQDQTVTQPFYINRTGVPGPGSSLHLTIDTGDGTIYEGGDNGTTRPKTATYEVNATNLQNTAAGEDASFSIRPMDDTTNANDFNHNDVQVHLGSALLDGLRAAGVDDFTVRLVPDGDGNPQIELVANNVTYTYDGSTNTFVPTGGGTGIPAGNTTVTGQLPTAVQDTLVEGNETFTPTIVNPSGNVYPDDVPPQKVTIVDENQPRAVVRFGYMDDNGDFVYVDNVTEGDLTAPNGQPYMMHIDLFDADGNPLVVTGEPVVFSLQKSGTAEDGTDIVVHSDQVTIFPGQSSTTVPVTFPNDYVSDGEKNFTMTVSIDSGGGVISGVYYDTGSGSPGTSPAQVIINDLIDGPNVTLGFAGGAVGSENETSKTISESGSGDFIIKLDRAVEEDSTVKVQLTFDNVQNTSQGMTPEDIQSFTIDGQTYLVSDIVWSGNTGTVGGLTIERGVNSEGKPIWTFDVPVYNGTAGSNFSIGMFNDEVSENRETLHVSVAGVEGGELRYDPASNQLDLHVEDVLDGPLVSLTPRINNVDEGQDLNFSLNLSKPADNDFDATFRLEGDWKSLMQPAPDGNYYVYCASQAYQVDDDGYFTVPVPAGSSGALPIHIDTLPDNSTVDGNRTVTISLENLSGDEAQKAGAPHISSLLESQDGAGSNYLLSTASGDTFDENADVMYFLDGLTAADVANTRVTVNGQAYPIQESDGKYYVLVQYSPGGGVNDVIRIENTQGSGAYTSNIVIDPEVTMKAVVVVHDDSPGSGPLLGLYAHSDPVEDGGVFSFSLERSTLPQDTPALATGLTVHIGLNLDNAAIDEQRPISVTDGNGNPMQWTYSNGQLTITIPEGMSAAEIQGIRVDVPIADVGSTGGTVSASINGITQLPGSVQYENPQYDSNPVSKDALPPPVAPEGRSFSMNVNGNEPVEVPTEQREGMVTHVLALAAAGIVLPGEQSLEDTLGLTLRLDGLDSRQKEAVALQLNSLEHVEAVLDTESGSIAIQLQPGYSSAIALSFDLDSQSHEDLDTLLLESIQPDRLMLDAVMPAHADEQTAGEQPAQGMAVAAGDAAGEGPEKAGADVQSLSMSEDNVADAGATVASSENGMAAESHTEEALVTWEAMTIPDGLIADILVGNHVLHLPGENASISDATGDCHEMQSAEALDIASMLASTGDEGEIIIMASADEAAGLVHGATTHIPDVSSPYGVPRMPTELLTMDVMKLPGGDTGMFMN